MEKEYAYPTLPTGYREMTEYIEKELAGSPHLSFTYLGSTVLGKGIPLLALGDTEAKTAYLYVGAHHGMEHITSSLLLTFAKDFNETAKTDGAPPHLIYVVPMLNCDGADIEIRGVPDGCILRERLLRMNGSEDFTKWQANARGVDLNHNYDAGFYEYKRIERELGISNGSRTKYSGEYPESEPEVGAICNFIRFYNNIKGCLTLHTQGEEIYFGDSLRVPDAEQIAGKIGEATGYKVCRPEGTALYGGMTDWVTSSLGIPSFTVECGKGENPLPASCFPHLYSRLRRLFFTFPSMIG